MYVCMYVCMCVCMCVCVCIHVCMCVYVYVCMYVCMHVCMYVVIYLFETWPCVSHAGIRFAMCYVVKDDLEFLIPLPQPPKSTIVEDSSRGSMQPTSHIICTAKTNSLLLG